MNLNSLSMGAIPRFSLNATRHLKDEREMDSQKKSRSIFRRVIGLVLVCIATACSLFAYVSVTVSGTASLPNGMTATINGPFSCSEKPARTEIEAGGHVFAFSPTAISIDGTNVRPLDTTVKDVRIDAGYWSAALRINGNEVLLK